jgi:LacI family transcriptional regulator
MPVRMKDIAKDLGISVVAVSKCINNHSDVSEATRQRVLRRIKELNYQPNLHAQGLASGRSFIVGFIVPDLVHAFFSEVAKSLSKVLESKGYGLVLSCSDENEDLENREIEQMVRRRVDALLIASCQSTPDHLKQLTAQNIPHILVDRRFERFRTNFVGTNDVLVGELATEHLISIGRRKIAHIGGTKIRPSVDRLRGYRNALKRHGLRASSDYVVTRERSDELGDLTGCVAMEKLLKLKVRPDAVFCYNDPAAIGAMNAILNAGLKIPEDIALVGAGNIRYSESLRVPLSSVDVPSAALGEKAGLLALDLMASHKQPEQTSFLVQPKLIIRESSVGVPRDRHRNNQEFTIT